MERDSDDAPLADTQPDAQPTPILPIELEATIVDRPRATIEPVIGIPADLGAGAGAGLSHSDASRGGIPGFRTHEILGEGGMGIVRAAEQISLGRQVAVKTVRSSRAGDPGVAMRFLREAWLAGRIEHPNVVPIYDVGIDATGVPHIAMRKVEGMSWDALIRAPETVRLKYGATDVLEWHIRVLVQVTHAISRAHTKGIVHRDIKPENVMIGEFGEVYLLDWGIAVSLTPDPAGRLPLASDAEDVAGTPCYMAPEMLGGSPSRIDERTDVYLLGATLYEIVTGEPPHMGTTFGAMMRSILLATPVFPPEVPRELARISARAMQRVPSDRYASAHELRLALTDFLTHRGSNVLANDASARRDELLAKLDRAGGPDRQAVYDAFGAARFGYQEALKMWPMNEEASEGLRLVCGRMIAFELADGSAEAAHAVLAELPLPPPELVARVELALRAREEEKLRLETLERQYDTAVGRRTRFVLCAALGVFGVVGPLVLSTLGPPTIMQAFAAKSMGAVLCGGLLLWARDSLRQTKMNRDLAFVMLGGFVVQALLVPALALLGLSVVQGMAIAMLVWSLLGVALAITTERRFLAIGLAFGAAFVATAARPAWAHLAQSIAAACSVPVLLSAWTAPAVRDGGDAG